MLELEAAVRRMLEEAQSSSPENAMSVADLRTNLAELFEDLGELFARAPEKRDQPHWRLWVMDVDDSAPATFAVAVVHPQNVELFAGTADPSALHGLQDGGYAGPPEKLAEVLAERGATLSPVRIDTPARTAHAWTGYEP